MFDGLVDLNSDNFRRAETSGVSVINASTDSFSQPKRGAAASGATGDATTAEAWESMSNRSSSVLTTAKGEGSSSMGTGDVDDESFAKIDGQTALTLDELAGTGDASRSRRGSRREGLQGTVAAAETTQWPNVRGTERDQLANNGRANNGRSTRVPPSPKRASNLSECRDSQLGLQVLTERRSETGDESDSLEQYLKEERKRKLERNSRPSCFRRMSGRDYTLRRSSSSGVSGKSSHGTGGRRRSSAKSSAGTTPSKERRRSSAAMWGFRRSSEAKSDPKEMARAALRAAMAGGYVPNEEERRSLMEGAPAAAAPLQDPERASRNERSSSIDGEHADKLGAQLEHLLMSRRKGLVIDPERRWIKYWNLLQLLCAVYGYTIVIWRVAFRSGGPMPRMSNDFTCTIDWATDVLLYVHMVLQLFIGYTDTSNNKVLDASKILRRYLASRRFPVHVLAGMPVDLLQLWQWRWIPICRANKLLRVLELRGLLKHLLDAFRVRVHFQRLLWQLVMMMLFSHTTACGYFMFGSIFDGFDATSWSPPATMLNESSAIQYFDSVYWSLGLMTGLADGDVPVSAHESVFTLVVMMIGIFLFAAIIGNVSTMIDELNENEGVFQTKLLYMSRMMRQHQLPPQLEDRVMNYYTYQYKNHQGFDNFQMLQTLPAGLRTDIMLQLTRSMIERVPFFEGVAEGFVRSLVDRLRPQIAAAGERIVEQGQLGNEMYFVHRGEFDVLVGKPPVIVAKLRQGNYFGEALIVNKPRAATVQASTFCDLFTLTRRALTEVLAYYPETAQKMHQLVAKRLEEDRAKERQAELVHKYGKKWVELLHTKQKREAMRRKQSFSQMMKKSSFRQPAGSGLKAGASFRANKSFRFDKNASFRVKPGGEDELGLSKPRSRRNSKSFSRKKVGQQPSDGVVIGDGGGKGGLDLGDFATEAEEEDVEGDEADVEAKALRRAKSCSSYDRDIEASTSAPPIRPKSQGDPDMMRKSSEFSCKSLSDGDGRTPVRCAGSGGGGGGGGGGGVTFGASVKGDTPPTHRAADKEDDRPFEQRQNSFIKRSSSFMGGGSFKKLTRLGSFRGSGGQQSESFQKKLAHVETSKRSRTPWWLARIGVTKARSKEDYFLVVLPHGPLRLLWLFLLFISVTWNVVIVPYAIAFLWGHHKLYHGAASALPLSHFAWVLGPDYVSDVVFLVDLFLHQRLAFIDDQGILVKDARVIGARSRQRHFSTALAAVLPLDAIFFGAYQWCPLLRLNRLLHMSKVLTVPPDLLQAFTYTGEGRAKISPYTALRIYRLLCTFFAIAHYSACLSMLIAALGTPLSSVSFALEGDTLFPNGVVIRSSFKLYLRALYWAISNLTGLGRDIKPITVGEHLFTLTVWCLGIFVFAYTIGTVGMLISNFDAGETRYNKTRNSVFRYMAYQKLPSELKARAFNFFEFTWARTKGVEIQEVVTDLNSALSTDVMSHICRDAVKNVPVFASRGDEFVSSIVQVLSFQAFPQGEWLMRKGTIGREMFFILKGEVEIIVDESLMFVIKTLSVGEFVGEGALFQDQGKRGGSVRAQTSCETMVLSKDGFLTVLQVYPDIEKDLLDASKKRQQDTQVAQKALDRRMSNCADGGGRRMSLGMVAQAALSCAAERRMSVGGERRMSIGGDRARRNSIRDVATFAMARRNSVDVNGPSAPTQQPQVRHCRPSVSGGICPSINRRPSVDLRSVAASNCGRRNSFASFDVHKLASAGRMGFNAAPSSSGTSPDIGGGRRGVEDARRNAAGDEGEKEGALTKKRASLKDVLSIARATDRGSGAGQGLQRSVSSACHCVPGSGGGGGGGGGGSIGLSRSNSRHAMGCRRSGSDASCAASSKETSTCASARQHQHVPMRSSSEASLDERLQAGLLGSSSPNNRSAVSIVSDAGASSKDGGDARPPSDPSVDGSTDMSRQHSMGAMVLSSGGGGPITRSCSGAEMKSLSRCSSSSGVQHEISPVSSTGGSRVMSRSGSRVELASSGYPSASRSPSLARCGSASLMTRSKRRKDDEGASPRCDDY